MKIQKRRWQTPQKNRGAVLLVSLVILLVMTLLGVSTMQSTTLDLQMATNNQSRQEAFQAAESALVLVEESIEASSYNMQHFQTCSSGDTDCYESTCAGGLCFSGSFGLEESQYECDAFDDNTVQEKVWRDPQLDVWNTSTKHKTLQLKGMENKVKYIIEFLCYTKKSEAEGFSPDDPNNGTPFFRITTLATSNNGKARVALQSTYRYSAD